MKFGSINRPIRTMARAEWKNEVLFTSERDAAGTEIEAEE
jgi:hypothetical protein